jgi:hypothetical protein
VLAGGGGRAVRDRGNLLPVDRRRLPLERGAAFYSSMDIRMVQVSLVASDESAVTETGTLQQYSSLDRVRRAAIVLLVAVLLAASLIPIPIVHLLGIPMMLIAGLVFSGRQLLITCRLKPVRIRCPRCDGVNRVGGGLGFRSVSEPMERMCEVCRRVLRVRVMPD